MNGYIVIAQNSDHNYIEYAKTLSLSIKATQSVINSVTLITDEKSYDSTLLEYFDYVKILEEDTSGNDSWKIHNKWQIFNLSPYDRTILLDADMLFPRDISHWWEYLEKFNVFINNNAITYRNEKVRENITRQTFIKNNLPSIYTAFLYFDKSDFSKKFFIEVEKIYKNYEIYRDFYLDYDYQNKISGDIVFSIAIKHLDMERLCTDTLGDNIIKFIHMKNEVQHWKRKPKDNNWTNSIRFTIDKDANLFVGNYRQNYPFHYNQKSFPIQKINRTYKSLIKEKNSNVR